MAKFATNLVGKKVILSFGLDAAGIENAKKEYANLSGHLRHVGQEAEIVVVNPTNDGTNLTIKLPDGSLIQTDHLNVKVKD